MRKSMPWYMYPQVTCKVLNRVASRVCSLEVCKDVMDICTMALWRKQEMYYASHK